jgi:hypothetical protein
MAAFLGEVLVHLKDVGRVDVQKEAVLVLGKIFSEEEGKMSDKSVGDAFSALGDKGVLESAAGASAAALMTNILADYGFLLERDNALVIKSICKRVGTPKALHDQEANTFLALLNNLTTSETNCIAVADSLIEKGTMALMAKNFLDYNPQMEDETYPADAEWDAEDNWQFMGPILCNFARVENIRTFLFQRFDQNYIAPLLKQIRSKNPTRRRGVVATLRTLLFKNECHWRLVVEENCCLHLMLPLVVSHETFEEVSPFSDYDKNGMDVLLSLKEDVEGKTYEQDENTLCLILDCLRLLCVKRVIRYELRKQKLYPVLRNLDLALTENETLHDKLFQPIRDIVDLLTGDEDPDEERAEREPAAIAEHDEGETQVD